MSLKEKCVHCLDLQQIPRPEKKKCPDKMLQQFIQFSNRWEKKIVSYLGEL